MPWLKKFNNKKIQFCVNANFKIRKRLMKFHVILNILEAPKRIIILTQNRFIRRRARQRTMERINWVNRLSKGGLDGTHCERKMNINTFSLRAQGRRVKKRKVEDNIKRNGYKK